MTDKPLKKCPECKKSTLVRLIGAGAGIIFKGSGFYETDYKRRNGKSPAKEDSPAPCPQTACPSAKECPASKVNTDT